MVNDRVFHIYKKNTKTTEVIKHSVTTFLMENFMEDRMFHIYEAKQTDQSRCV